MFVMLPVMFLARKIDGEDPNVIYWLRVAYGTVQVICVLIVAYTYIQASAASSSNSARGKIYVPPAATVRREISIIAELRLIYVVAVLSGCRYQYI